jgi:hypothetical protein
LALLPEPREVMENLEVLHNQIRLTVLVFAGLAIIVGFRKTGMKIIQSTLLMALLSPFLMALLQQLPLWLVIPGLLLFIGFLFKSIIGNEAWGHFFGAILYDVLWRLPLRIIGSVWRRLRNLFHQMVD